MSRIATFLVCSVPLYVALALLSFRGVQFGASPEAGAAAIAAHEFDYVLQWTYVAVCVLLFAAYFWSLIRLGEPAPSVVFGVGALLGLLSWCAYPGVNSNDIMAYVGYGRILGVYHENPWVNGYEKYADFYTPYAWYRYPMPYGPVVAPFLGVAGHLSEIGVPLAFYFLKSCWLCVHLCSGWLVWRIAAALHGDGEGASGVSPTWSAWAFLCNPLLLLELVNNGHCDGLLVMFALLSTYALVSRPVAGAGFDGRALCALILSLVAMLVKPTAVLLLVTQVILLLRQRNWLPVGVAAILGLAVAGLLATTLFASPQAREALTNPHILTNAHSFHSVIIHMLGLNTHSTATEMAWYLWLYESDAYASARQAVALSFAIFCLWRLLSVRTCQDVIREYLWMTLGLMLFYSARVWPWYMAWLVPFAVVVDSAPLRRSILLYSFTMLAVYALPFALMWESFGWHLLRVFLSSGVPMLFLAAHVAWSESVREGKGRGLADRGA